jgi:transcriptional regulator with XRE-family HTH domain
MNQSTNSPEDLLAELGSAIKARRLARNFTQREVAAKADVALRSLIYLEAGRSSTTDTLVRILKAMGSEDLIAQLAPRPGISPIALLKAPKLRRRASGRRPSLPEAP